ncbi:unnamed protein product [Didymodactylos carnosus]|uniref:Uncharacterized protein n=2 Tax=Didymodactylos carnosus TaxID=1234261 RepID=A0A815JN85_9BILA|nr:unnamed protein product [Didymodactylos carnosus]CAF4278657.1 unnamed protein product [Didymodactylos carnosus]
MILRTMKRDDQKLFVDNLHELRQVTSISILCNHPDDYNEWKTLYSKLTSISKINNDIELQLKELIAEQLSKKLAYDERETTKSLRDGDRGSAALHIREAQKSIEKLSEDIIQRQNFLQKRQRADAKKEQLLERQKIDLGKRGAKLMLQEMVATLEQSPSEVTDRPLSGVTNQPLSRVTDRPLSGVTDRIPSQTTDESLKQAPHQLVVPRLPKVWVRVGFGIVLGLG